MRTSNVLSVLLGAGLIWGCASVDEAAAPSAPEAPRAPAATEAPKAPEPPAPPQTATSGFTPDASLALCPRESVSNAPPHTGEDRVLTNFSPFVRVKGVKLAVVPTNNACLSSGFGLRNGKLHKGIDVQNDPAEMVYSGAAGTIREAGWREDDYGNYVVIDHGDFVTLYSHLANLEAGVKVDAEVPYGFPLGVMGQSGAVARAIHLHYEVREGDYDAKPSVFLLEPKNILSYPPAS